MKSDDTREIFRRAFNGHEEGFTDDHFEFVEAMHLSMWGHRDQWRDRRHTVLYALHPFRILALAEHIFNPLPSYVKASILMHDLFEDTDVTAQDARKAGISERVIGIALELTCPQVDIENVQERRKVKLNKLLTKAREMSNEARFIKAMDRVYNLADAFQTFSRPKLWHYMKEAVHLYHALSYRIPADDFESYTMSALAYFRKTINAVIEASQERGDDQFKNFDLL